jgi:hypothetical protein
MTEPTDPNSPEHRRSHEVARWLSHRFAEDPWWEVDELIMRARQDGIILGRWYRSPAVKALGIRAVRRAEPWPSGPTLFYTTEPKATNEETKTDAVATTRA